MSYSTSFGQWLIERRKQLRLQRTKLAEQIGCATITLRKIETDERRPSQQLAELLAEHLRLPSALRPIFVRVARGEIPADYLPSLVSHTSTAMAGQPGGRESSSPRKRIPTNLTAPLTTRIGRDQELEDVQQLLQQARLVTLTGAGGVGKTRLAIEVGMQLVQSAGYSYPDGIWLVELAALSEPALVAQALVHSLGVPSDGDLEGLALLRAYLADRQVLIVVDTCEHLVASCAMIAEHLLQHCWRVRILTTSRVSLRVPGERIYTVRPLELPHADEHGPVQILQTAAAQLFLARMAPEPRWLQQKLDLAPIISRICHQLDGMPLAIELAASLARRMTLEQITDQLQAQMALPPNSYRTAMPHHQTIDTVLAWSYQLLDEHAQRVLLRASVFRGSWSLEAAQAVCHDPANPDLAATLERLVDGSFVLIERHATQQRYRLLEPVRQFAQALLAETGDARMVARRHAFFYLSLAEQMHAARDTSREKAWLDRLEPERTNLYAVNQWAIEHGEAEFAHRLNGCLFAFWIYRMAIAETRYWIEVVLALQAPVLTPSAAIAEALANDVAGYLGVARRNYAFAEQCFRRELQLYQPIGQLPGIATAYRGLGFTAMLRGDLAQAALLIARSLEVSQACDDYWGAAWSLFDLGYLAMLRGQLAEAQDRLEAALPEFIAQDNLFGAFRLLIALGHVLRERQEPDQAMEQYRRALELQQRMGYIQLAWDALEGVGSILASYQPERAVALFAAADTTSMHVAFMRWQHRDTVLQRSLALARSQLAPAVFQAAWEAGAAMRLDQAVAYALQPQERQVGSMVH